MPSITSSTPAVGKTEKVLLLDVPEAFKQAASVIEKKCRNLEKRKGKLDGYREEASKGKKLPEDKQQAVAHYDEVIATLELTREFIGQFEKIGIEASKEEKKRKKKEAFDQAQRELSRFKELFTIQEVFNCLRSESYREDFMNGCRGAPQFSENDLQKLDAFFTHISVDRDNVSTNFNDAVTTTATHYQRLLDGYNKEVAGTTYREVKDLIQRVVSVGYFDWKPQPEVKEPEPTKEPEVEAIRPDMHNQEMYCPIAEERPYVESGFEYIEPPAPLPTMPQVPQPTGYFPVEVETDFNFIQESLIDSQPVLPMVPPTSVPMGVGGPAPSAVPVSLASVDSAVMMVHSQVPPAHLAYSFLASGNPAAAAAASLYGSAPLVPAPSSTLPTAELIAESARTASPVAPQATSAAAPQPVETPQVNPTSANATTTTSSAWAEEPQDDMPPYQQDQTRNPESNTWTNSNYRSNDQDTNGRRGGFRGRGNGGPRGSRGNSGNGYYNNSRNEGGNGGYRGGDRQGNGERSDRNYDRYQNNGGERNGTDRGGYQQRDGDRDRSSYQNNNGGGRYHQNGNGGYQGNNQGSYGGNRTQDRGGAGGERSNYGPRGGYRGGSSTRGGPPRGGSSSRGNGGGYDRNTNYARE